MSPSQNLPGTSIITSATSLDNTFWDGCDNERSDKNKLFLFIEHYLVYNIIWLDKLNICFAKTESQSYYDYKFI